VLYEQMHGANSGNITSMDFAATDNLDAQGADDFNVPPGFPWSITSVDVSGSGVSGDTVSVLIYGDALALPGALAFEQGGIPLPVSPTPNIPVTGLALDPGNYWISVQARGSNQWSWSAFNPPAAGDPAVWRNPANGYGYGCTSYQPLSSCLPGAVSSDFSFRLNGNVASNLFTLGRSRRLPNGRARLPATFPAPGQITLVQARGRALVRRLARAVGAGRESLVIRPTRRARRRLRRGKIVTTKVRATFTPTGGNAKSMLARVSLKKRVRR
jgi:hypothetical protein